MPRLTLFLVWMLAACAPTGWTSRDFQAVVSNQIIDFYHEIDGLLVYGGSERFLPGQRVVWVTADGACQEGRWYAQAGAICFNYGEETMCWRHSKQGLVPGALFAFESASDRVLAFPGTLKAVPESCAR